MVDDDLGGAPARAGHRLLGPEALGERHHGEARRQRRQRLDDLAHHGEARHADGLGQRRHAADHLAVERLVVEEALTGDDEVGALEVLVEGDLVGDDVEPRHQLGPDRGQPAGQPAGRAAALEGLHVDARLLEEHLGEALEATGEQLHLGGRRALLRTEHGGRVDEAGAHVARHHQLDPPQALGRVERLQRAEPAVGGGRAAHPDEHPAGTRLDGQRRSARRCRRWWRRPGRCRRPRRRGRGPRPPPSR